MMGTTIAFGIAAGTAILICYWLLKRLPRGRVVNRPARSGPAGGHDAGDGGSHLAWSAGENSASDHPGAASDSGGAGDSGGGDSGGGGDTGGSDAGGGGDGGGGSD